MLNHQGTGVLTTPRLTLRPFAVEDAHDMYTNWASDPDVTQFLTWQPHGNELVSEWIIAEWATQYGKPDYYAWAIVYEGHAIGSIAVVNRNDSIGKAEVGYAIGRRWWRQGFATEALTAVIGFLLDEVGYQRVECRHDPRNRASGAVMRKCGMQYEGTLRQSDRNNQGVCDACWYSILKGER